MNKNILLVKELKNSVMESIADGDGFRLTLFTQGCNHHCKGCQNPNTWSWDSGVESSVDEIVNYISGIIKRENYDGVTISGGDPLSQEHIGDLLKGLKDEGINIWVYSGFTYEEIKDNDYIKYIDVLVDGRFIEEMRKPPFKRFRGSNNQRILRLKDGIIVREE